MRHVSLVVLVVAASLAGCASAPSAPPVPSYRAPWADLGKVQFTYLLASYGNTNISLARAETLDKYLRSQTKTFDRYIAAKEVGASTATLEGEALAEIQQRSGELSTLRFVVRTELKLQNYDAQLGGFPIFAEPFDKNAGLRYYNDDVRSSPSKDRKTYGVSVAAKDYGFMEAEIWFSKLGWVLPATPDQAARFLEGLSRSGGARKIAVAMVYSVDRCNQDTSDKYKLVCDGTIRNLYGYPTLEGVLDETPPLVTLEKRQS